MCRSFVSRYAIVTLSHWAPCHAPGGRRTRARVPTRTLTEPSCMFKPLSSEPVLLPPWQRATVGLADALRVTQPCGLLTSHTLVYELSGIPQQNGTLSLRPEPCPVMSPELVQTAQRLCLGVRQSLWQGPSLPRRVSGTESCCTTCLASCSTPPSFLPSCRQPGPGVAWTRTDNPLSIKRG